MLEGLEALGFCRLQFRCVSHFICSLSPNQHAELKVEMTKSRKPKIPNNELVFGKFPGDHMLSIDWDVKSGWTSPKIMPHSPICLDPTASVFHYALECFEGLKAYKDKLGKPRLFRPLDNMARMNRSAARLALPVCTPCLPPNFHSLIYRLQLN